MTELNAQDKAEGLAFTKKYSYDGLGRKLTQTNAKGVITIYTYDSSNNVTSVSVKASADAPAKIIAKYTYDYLGKKLTETDANGNKTTYTYNAFGKPATATFAGDSTIASITRYYQYDSVGNLTRQWDTSGKMLIYTYDNNNNLLTVTDESGTITRTYDDFGRVLTKTVPCIGTATYAYDIVENMQEGECAETAQYPQGEVVTKVYDKAGRLSKVVACGDTTKYNYYDNGSVQSVVYDNGAKEGYTYTANNLLSTLTNKKADGTIISTYSYSYDGAGNILSKADNMGTTSYLYDSINRLASETNPDGKTTAYTYDGSGNRLTETTTLGTHVTVISYTYDTSNKLTQTETKVNGDTTQITSYTYDDNGNMLEKRLTPFVDSTAQTQIVKLTNVYDRFNQLTMSITDDGKTVCNTYNGEGLRIRKDVNGVATNYLYEGMKVVAEYDGEYNLGAQNVQGLNLLMRVEQNATYYYMYNGHADVTALLSAQTGNIDATYYYDAFGTVLSQTGNVSNSYLYAGYQYDEETGLYYLNARMYDSETARFVQEDTYRGNPNDPLSLNLYTYCANNPLKYEDPSGHSWISTKFNNLKKSVSKKIETAKKVVKSVVNTVKTKITNSSTYKKAAEFYNKHEQTIKKVAIVTATVAAIALGVTATVATGGLAGAVIGGALTGMGMGIGITGVSDYMDDHKINKSMNEYLANAGGGAIAGGILGAGGFMMAEGVMANTLASTMTLGGTSAMAGNMTTQFMGKGSIDPVQALEAGIIGAATAGLFYGVSKIVGGITNSITSKGNSQNANTAQLNDGIVKSGSELGKLKSIGNGAWESTEGLIYEQGSKQGNRVLHVLEHTVPDPSKPLHSVFNAGRDKVLGVVDEAWSMRNSVTPILQKNGNQVFDIPMSKIIGTNGETTIRIVVENGTSKIVTSFPVK